MEGQCWFCILFIFENTKYQNRTFLKIQNKRQVEMLVCNDCKHKKKMGPSKTGAMGRGPPVTIWPPGDVVFIPPSHNKIPDTHLITTNNDSNEQFCRGKGVTEWSRRPDFWAQFLTFYLGYYQHYETMTGPKGSELLTYYVVWHDQRVLSYLHT
jgi:hypothetical protein